MSSVVSFAVYFDAIVTLVKVGEMEKVFALTGGQFNRQIEISIEFC